MGGTILLYLGNASKEGLYLGARIQQFLTCNFCVDHGKGTIPEGNNFFCIKYFAEDKRNIYLFTSIHYMTIARKAW